MGYSGTGGNAGGAEGGLGANAGGAAGGLGGNASADAGGAGGSSIVQPINTPYMPQYNRQTVEQNAKAIAIVPNIGKHW